MSHVVLRLGRVSGMPLTSLKVRKSRCWQVEFARVMPVKHVVHCPSLQGAPCRLRVRGPAFRQAARLRANSRLSQ
jgi:hypothetical protein